MCNQREFVDDWDTFFMNVAKDTSKRSKDPRTQVGACIVSPEYRILSVGYNGTPHGFNDEEFPWKSNENPLDSKYGYVVHAELNAILNYRGSASDLEDSTCYVTLFPCNECAKAIVQAGIKEVVYLSDEHNGEDTNTISKTILDTCGVKYRQFKPNGIMLNTTIIPETNIYKAEQVLRDNGIDDFEIEVVLQAIGYTLLDTELYPLRKD